MGGPCRGTVTPCASTGFPCDVHLALDVPDDVPHGTAAALVEILQSACYAVEAPENRAR